MRRDWLPAFATAALAETLAYYLSLTWGFMALLLAFIVTSLMASGTAAKSRSTEARVNAILPVLGAHSTRITTAQNAANNAQSTANTANTTANNAQGAANNAQATANGAVQYGSDPTFSAMTVTGAATIQGNLNANGGGNVVKKAGGSLNLGTSGSGSPDGNSGSAWGSGERNYINGLWAAVAGINNYLN